MTWVIDIIRGLRALDGEASLQRLYAWIKKNRKSALPDHWKDAIRAELQSHCSDSKQYKSGNPNVFRNTGRGWWAIREPDDLAAINLSEQELIKVVLLKLTPDDQTEAIASGDLYAYLQTKAKGIKRELLQGKPPQR